jgi:ABC-type sugar transport system permease subunit
MDNLVRAFTRDENFWHTVVNTLIYSAGKICMVLPLAFIVAVLLNGRQRGKGILQSIIFSPTILSSAVMALVFYLLLNAYNGEVNRLLINFHIIRQPVNWLGKDMAMLSVIIVAIWGGLGNYMVYFLAGLQQVPNELYESGEIDGTTKFTRLIYITLPMLGPVLKVIIMLSILAAFQDMQSIMVLTEGGPFEATDVMFLYVYRLYFPVTVTGAVAVRQYGYGAAVAIICAAIVGIVTLIYLYVSRKMDDIY